MRFRVYSTGESFDDSNLTHLGTVNYRDIEWHVYLELAPPS